MGLCSSCSLWRRTPLEYHDWLHRYHVPEKRQKGATVLHIFQVHGHDTSIGICFQVFENDELVDVQLVSHAADLAQVKPAFLADPLEIPGSDEPGLASDSNAWFLLRRQRGIRDEGRVKARAQVHDANGIRAHHARDVPDLLEKCPEHRGILEIGRA